MDKTDENAITMINVADCHIGYRPMSMTFAKQAERMKDFIKNFDEICEFTKRTKADLLVIAGDLFHTNTPGNQDRYHVTKELRAVHEAGTSIVIVGGDHDMPRSKEEGKSPIATLDASGIVYFFENIKEIPSIKLNIKRKMIRISGLSYNNFIQKDDDPLKEKVIPVDGDINIFVTHSNASFHKKKYAEEYEIKITDVPEPIDYVALGHIHEQHKSVRTNPNKKNKTFFAYPGSIEHVEILDNPPDKGFFQVFFQHDGNIEINFHVLKTRPTSVISVELSKDTKNIHEKILSQIPENLSPESIVKLKIKGTINLDYLETYMKVKLIDDFSKKFFNFSIEESPDLKKYSPLSKLESVETELPRNVLATYLDTALGQATNDDEKRFLTDVKNEILSVFNIHASEVDIGDE